ncbi:DUF4873 domain-containing protein [Saccharopolyspora subtropica]|uniref:DUF4873 domain-containing protein n=1 Tax=Saccharopolyspora thermophila TaxID=89367 RepID=A0A917JJC1_9PSEU|nr:DUF4873 domain-containing protein [Saccharopolyspora subtropica]GGI71086.1 DUF4873 domain-containing protein [Saccharopolyspora subtropica]
MHDHDEDDYRGPATMRAGDREIAVRVVLRGHFQPIDGRFHWYGRVAAHESVDELAARHRQDVLLRTPDGEAVGTLSDPDPWGRYRITGTGHPPFPVPTALG